MMKTPMKIKAALIGRGKKIGMSPRDRSRDRRRFCSILGLRSKEDPGHKKIFCVKIDRSSLLSLMARELEHRNGQWFQEPGRKGLLLAILRPGSPFGWGGGVRLWA
jgi:hypothetical protein